MVSTGPVLDAEEIKRRVTAARILRDLSQTELDALFRADGLGKLDAGRVERGELAMTRVHRDAFCRHLRVPERWFLSEDVDEIVGFREDQVRQAAELARHVLLEAAQAGLPAVAPDSQAPGTQGPTGQAGEGAR